MGVKRNYTKFWTQNLEGRAQFKDPRLYSRIILKSILHKRRLVAQLCALFKAYSGERAWKAIGNRLIKQRHLSRSDHNRNFRNRKQRRVVGKYSFLNRTITNWNQLPAGLLASFPCKLNTFRKRVKNVVTAKGKSSVD